MKCLCPDTEEDRIVAQECLSQRVLCEGESIDELARDLEKLLERASPGLPAEIQDSELRFYLINSLPEQVSLQPKLSYAETIAKARELRLIYDRTKGKELEFSPSKMMIVSKARRDHSSNVRATNRTYVVLTRSPREESMFHMRQVGPHLMEL